MFCSLHTSAFLRKHQLRSKYQAIKFICNALWVPQEEKNEVNMFLCSFFFLSLRFSTYARAHISTAALYFLTTQKKDDDNEKLERTDNKMAASRNGGVHTQLRTIFKQEKTARMMARENTTLSVLDIVVIII
jgi:hypothetical protein